MFLVLVSIPGDIRVRYAFFFLIGKAYIFYYIREIVFLEIDPKLMCNCLFIVSMNPKHVYDFSGCTGELRIYLCTQVGICRFSIHFAMPAIAY